MNPARHPFDHRHWFENWKVKDRPNWEPGFRPFVFRHVDAIEFFILLVLGRTEVLANKFVDISGRPAWTQDEIVQYLKAAARPVDVRKLTAKAD